MESVVKFYQFFILSDRQDVRMKSQFPVPYSGSLCIFEKNIFK
jgi:hypothetical protein